MSVPIIIIILVFAVCLIALCCGKSPEKPVKRRDPAPYTSMLENGSNSYFVLIEIKPFLDTYMEGASIPEELFFELMNKSAKGQKYAEIPRHVLDRVKTRLRKYQKQNAALSECCRLNNIGIEQEKTGDIDGAIATYEKNISAGYPATHSFDRLMILYRKRKEYDKEIVVIEKAIALFDLQNKENAEKSIMSFPSRKNEILSALKTCSVVYGDSVNEYGKRSICFNPYDINKYKSRLEKAQSLKSKEVIYE